MGQPMIVGYPSVDGLETTTDGAAGFGQGAGRWKAGRLQTTISRCVLCSIDCQRRLPVHGQVKDTFGPGNKTALCIAGQPPVNPAEAQSY